MSATPQAAGARWCFFQIFIIKTLFNSFFPFSRLCSLKSHSATAPALPSATLCPPRPWSRATADQYLQMPPGTGVGDTLGDTLCPPARDRASDTRLILRGVPLAPSSSATPAARGEAGSGDRSRGTQGTHGTVFTGGPRGHTHSHTYTKDLAPTGRAQPSRGTRRLAGRWAKGYGVRRGGRFPARPELGTHLPHLAHTAVAKRAGAERGRGGCLHLSRRVRRGFGKVGGHAGERRQAAPCARCRDGDTAAVPAPSSNDKKKRGNAGTQPNKLEAGWERGKEGGAREGGSEPVGGALDERHFAELHHGRAGLVLHPRHPLQQLLRLALGVPQLLPPLHQLGVALRGGYGSEWGLPEVPGLGWGWLGAPQGGREGYGVAGGSPGCQGSGVALNFLYLCPVMTWRAKRAGLVARKSGNQLAGGSG